jgi:integrase
MDALLSRRVYVATRRWRRPEVRVVTMLPVTPTSAPATHAWPDADEKVLHLPGRLEKARARRLSRREGRLPHFTKAQWQEFHAAVHEAHPDLDPRIQYRRSPAKGNREWKYGVTWILYLNVERRLVREHHDVFPSRQISCADDLVRARGWLLKIQLYSSPDALRPASTFADGFPAYLADEPKPEFHRTAGDYRKPKTNRLWVNALKRSWEMPGPDGRPLGVYPRAEFAPQVFRHALRHIPYRGKSRDSQWAYIVAWRLFFDYLLATNRWPAGRPNPVDTSVRPVDYERLETAAPKGMRYVNVAQAALALKCSATVIKWRIATEELKADLHGRGYWVLVDAEKVLAQVRASMPPTLVRARPGRDFYSVAEWIHVYETEERLGAEGPVVLAALRLDALAGFRHGELLGLRREDGRLNPAYNGDPDVPKGWVSVLRQVDGGEYDPTKTRQRVDVALTEATWALFVFLCDAASALVEDSRQKGRLAPGAGAVIPLLPRVNGKPQAEEWLNAALSRMNLRAGLGDRALYLSHLHALRHVRATLLAMVCKEQIPAAAAAMGISVATFLQDYVGVSYEEIDRVSLRAQARLEQEGARLQYEREGIPQALRQAEKAAWAAADAGDRAAGLAQEALFRVLFRRAHVIFAGDPPDDIEPALIKAEDRVLRAIRFTDDPPPPDGAPRMSHAAPPPDDGAPNDAERPPR